MKQTHVRRVGLQILTFILIAALFIASGYLGYYLSQSQQFLLSCTGGAILAISVVAIGWLLLSVMHHLFKRPLFVAVAFLILYTCGIVLYRNIDLKKQQEKGDVAESLLVETDNGDRWLVDRLSPINNTLSIFFPSRGSYNEEGSELAAFQIIHLLSYLFFAMLAFSIFGRRLINRNGYWLIPYNCRNIFWDISPGGTLLAVDILNKTVSQQTIFVLPISIRDEQEKDQALFEHIDEMGAVALYRDFDLMRKNLRGHRHFFLSEDQDFNLRMALYVANSHKGFRKLHLYVRTEMEHIGEFFSKYHNTEVYVFNQSDLTARKYIADYPMLETAIAQGAVAGLQVNYHFRLLCLGFGWTGREVLNKTICDTQFVGSRFSATIVDKAILREHGEYPVLFDECIREYNIDFETDEAVNNVGSMQFYQWMEQNRANYDRVIVAMGDDILNLNVAVAIARIYQKHGFSNDKIKEKIFVHVRQSDKYCYDRYPVTLFGDLKTIYSVDVVIDEKMDVIAKAIDYVYSQEQGTADESIIPKEQILGNLKWSTYTANNIFNKDSSRATAMSIENMIRLAGGVTEFKNSIVDQTQLALLAHNEHLRWNAFHLTRGVRRWNVDEIPDCKIDDVKLKDEDGGVLLKHGCLVAYDKLDEISGKVNNSRRKIGNMQKKDYRKTDHRIIKHFVVFKEILDDRSKKTI